MLSSGFCSVKHNRSDAISAVIRPKEMGISAGQIKALNFLILKGLRLDQGVVPGEYRTHSELIGSVYRGPPEKLPPPD